MTPRNKLNTGLSSCYVGPSRNAARAVKYLYRDISLSELSLYPSCIHTFVVIALCAGHISRYQSNHLVCQYKASWRHLVRKTVVKRHRLRAVYQRRQFYHVCIQPPMTGAAEHCSFVLLADFDIDKGAQLTYQFPQPLGTDETSVIEPA